ncbi:MAG: glycosyltransferase [Candidatus Gastranaerophilales bacterium]|nr:glycosyltransferase [Candidatus Gastranaerophilales bacterium]
MNILFLHRGFPGQFKYIATVLANNPDNTVYFITNSQEGQINGINKVYYKLAQQTLGNCHPYLNFYEEAVIHGRQTAKEAVKLKEQGFKPDIIYGFAGWGSTMFMKEVFPDVPLLCYFEWFGKSKDSVFDFGGKKLTLEEKEKIKCENTHVLMSLYSCDAGICPTHWQKNQFPEEFHNKIHVIHDGVDTATCQPNNEAEFLGLTAGDEVITYGTRGMEPYRGFPEFMKAAEILLEKRPNAHIIIAGADETFYSPKAEKGTYKNNLLKELDLDMNRIHFTGILSFHDYVKLLQISSVHVYSTVPYVLSWSVLNAMAVGCCIVASNTAPVLEVIRDNYNGLLFDFYNVEQLVEKVEYVLDNKEKMVEIRRNARQSVIDNYALEKTLPQQFNLINNLCH